MFARIYADLAYLAAYGVPPKPPYENPKIRKSEMRNAKTQKYVGRVSAKRVTRRQRQNL
jgi:hypothetical protein